MEKIKKERRELDRIDDQILNLLRKRVNVCRSIGAIKRLNRIPVLDALREEALRKRIRAESVELDLDSEQVDAIYREIIALCTHVQTEFSARE
jgi:chorismate mutase